MEIKKLLNIIVLIAIGVSAICMLQGNAERGVLVCFWASLILSLYGPDKT